MGLRLQQKWKSDGNAKRKMLETRWMLCWMKVVEKRRKLMMSVAKRMKAMMLENSLKMLEDSLKMLENSRTV